MMRTIAEYLPEHPFFAGLDEETMSTIVGCARIVRVPAGELLFRTGDPADTFYAIRQGRVALEVHDPRHGGIRIATPSAGEVVGWSWLVPPYRWMFDARVVTSLSAVAIDGACLRGKCAQDPVLGYALMQRVAQVMYQRLQEARVLLLDLYRNPS